MAKINFTPPQRTAIETIGRGVVVSAAAGSGKTAVLAARCVHVICDAPPDQRCDVDRLLVLTFTDAAAAEMRTRIVTALRARLAEQYDERLREQVALAGSAQISTIHSFCLWLIRRWFTDVGIDAGATVLSSEEAKLLKREALNEMFAQLYADNVADDGHPLGVVDEESARESRQETAQRKPARSHPTDQAGEPQKEDVDPVLAAGFAGLVEDYGLGDDRNLARLVLRLSEFVESLPNPDRWLDDAAARLGSGGDRVIADWHLELAAELTRQSDHCAGVVKAILAGDMIGHAYAAPIVGYRKALSEWLETIASESADDQGDERFECLRTSIETYEFLKPKSPRLGRGTAPELLAARDEARDLYNQVRDKLFQKRLRDRFALYSINELREGLARVAPYARTLSGLVKRFRALHEKAKRQLDVLDFADLERLAFRLLTEDNDAGRPSHVARTLHDRFAHVLVDEFQDINPIQEAIIRLVSRSAAPDRPSNLFVVGDVKQSIYRFRLAEPNVFVQRWQESRSKASHNTGVALPDNFRSRPEILDCVNLLFAELMRPGAGDVVYDEDAHLRAGRLLDDAEHTPIELHILEKRWTADDHDDSGDNGESNDSDSASSGEDQERPGAVLDDPARWSAVEREAFWIGTRVRDWVASGDPRVTGEPLGYRDIVVLLRAAKVNAERIANMLRALGVPAHAAASGALFQSLEVVDVLSVLSVLDNPRQDIPLAALLRGGLLGVRFNEDELLAIRLLGRQVPFHACVFDYAEKGSDARLREKAQQLVTTVERLRDEARRRPLAEFVWTLYDAFGHLAAVSAMPNGQQRRANLFKLHELARTFGTFRRQGLHRFLRFIESLQEEEQDLAVAPPSGESEDVVRIMTMHQSKGLEFPVVFVAGLGTKLNLQDRSGSIIFDRQNGLGLRVVDMERMLEYPTAAHTLAADAIERVSREEELRVLYVALTRARDRLLMVGSRNKAADYVDRARLRQGAGGMTLLDIATANSPLDWIVPTLATAASDRVRWPGEPAMDAPTVEVTVHDQDEMDTWRTDQTATRAQVELRKRVSALEPLPAGEPVATDDPQVRAVMDRLAYKYPHLEFTAVPAALGVTEIAARYGREQPDEHRPPKEASAYQVVSVEEERAADPETRERARLRGTLTHRVLQHLDFREIHGEKDIEEQLQTMVEQGLIQADERPVIDREGVAWFCGTPLANRIREAGDKYHRELQYIASEAPETIDPDIPPGSEDHVLVRGVVDAILETREGLMIVDFKTDRIAETQVNERADKYRPQMDLYARAVSRMWRKPIRHRYLVFLSAQRVVDLGPHGESVAPQSQERGS